MKTARWVRCYRVQFISQKVSHLCVAQTAWIESRRQWTLLVLVDFDKYTVNAFLTGWIRDKNEAFSKTSWLRVQSKFVPTPLQRLVSQGPFALVFTGFSVRRCDQNNSSHKVSSTFSSL